MACALLLLEEDSHFLSVLKQLPGHEAVLEALNNSWRIINHMHGESAPLWIIRERHGLAGLIASRVQEKREK